MEPLRVVVYSDFLCPWCFNAHTRLASVRRTLGDAVAYDWRSYLLRPRPGTRRDLDRFRAYTRSWLRVAEDEPRAPFRVWEGDAGPPSHSIPPAVVAKAAATLGPEAEERMRERLFRAYFAESRDITDDGTLQELWEEAGLPEEAYARSRDPALEAAAFREHEEALGCGATGAPAVRIADRDVAVVGAQPEATYLRWFRRMMEGAS